MRVVILYSMAVWRSASATATLRRAAHRPGVAGLGRATAPARNRGDRTRRARVAAPSGGVAFAYRKAESRWQIANVPVAGCSGCSRKQTCGTYRTPLFFLRKSVFCCNCCNHAITVSEKNDYVQIESKRANRWLQRLQQKTDLWHLSDTTFFPEKVCFLLQLLQPRYYS
jgi:hypothetical protein